jgi:dTDP-4-amino-4,6-dideoxygalactose transaminase
MYTAKLKGVDRNKFLAELRARGIGASVHFDPPVHTQPFYVEQFGSGKLDLPVTMRVSRCIVTLPMYPGMSEDDVSYVAQVANEAAEKHRS